MITDILTRTYYGNSVQEWLFAFLIMLAAFLVGKVIYWFFGNVVKRLARKTKTKLDDIIVDMIEEPIVFIITIMGFWYGLNQLNFSETGAIWKTNILQALIICSIAW